MPNAHGDFIWYELTTTDADAAGRFYGDVTGWQVSDSGMPGIDYRMLMAGKEAVGGVLQLTHEMLDGGARPAWLGYIEVRDIGETLAAVADDGATVLMPAREIPEVGQFALLADPQGVPIYVMQSSSPDTSHAFRDDAPGHCAWNELVVPDVDAALDFYTRHFGWTRGEKMPMGDMGDYQMFEQDGTAIGGAMRNTPGEVPACWRYYIRVPKIDAAIAAIESGGGQVLFGPQEAPGEQQILVAQDPQGAVFSLVASAAS